MAGSSSLDRTLERLQRRYLRGAGDCEDNFLSDALLTRANRGRSKTQLDGLHKFTDGSSSPMSPISSGSVLAHRERKGYSKALRELFKLVKNVDSIGNEMDFHHDSSQTESGNKLHDDDDLVADRGQDSCTQIYTETDVTLPSYLAAINVTSTDQSIESSPEAMKQKARRQGMDMLREHDFLPSDVNRIYDELLLIHQKLQQESLAQHEFALQLKKREQCLCEKETLLFRHQAALTKIRGVEEEVHAKIRILKEQHQAEVKQLSDALKEKVKENKRLKSSFDTLKDLNDTMKKQLNDVSEQNNKLEIQAKKVQARLENLQRKYTFLTVQKCKDNVSQATQGVKSFKVEKSLAPCKNAKLPLNAHVYELLTLLMDWISEYHLSKLRTGEDKDTDKFTGTQSPRTHHIQEMCTKLLPILAEQLQWMPLVNSNLHMPLIHFTYWAIRQLESGTQQHTPMMSTMRRLGEDIFKGTVIRGTHDSSPQLATETRTKSAAFFKSPSLPMRLVSTLIVLKTVTQADYLAQAFDSLCMDLKTDEGKTLFLEYDAVAIITSHLRPSSKGLLSSAIDVLLQLTMESRYLKHFLEACSNESFFRACSVLLRYPKLDEQILEKLSILLQKLSKIKSNKKLFELHTIHLMIQEMQRTASHDQAFLIINLNSILFNLGFSKNSCLTSSLNTSH